MTGWPSLGSSFNASKIERLLEFICRGTSKEYTSEIVSDPVIGGKIGRKNRKCRRQHAKSIDTIAISMYKLIVISIPLIWSSIFTFSRGFFKGKIDNDDSSS